MMREFFREGDLISAEVQLIQEDGTLSLHTRSLRYGKVTRKLAMFRKELMPPPPPFCSWDRALLWSCRRCW